jgi:hypothetical protein
MSYIKTPDPIIKTARCPLIRDGEKEPIIGSVERGLKRFEVWNFLGESSEKGSTRKHTEKRVTRWRTMFWGNFEILR